MENSLGEWPIHFSILLDLTIEAEKSSPNARHARAFRFFRGKAYAAPDYLRCHSGPPGLRRNGRKGNELTTYVYENYYICVRNSLNMCVKLTTKAGQGQLRTPHNQSENSTFLTGKSAPPLPLRTMPNDHRAPGLLTRK